MPIRAVIADDEPLARERIRSLLADHSEVEVAAETRDGRETILAVQKHKPDLLFLDVEMPEIDGFGVLRAFAPSELPVVIFTTAYDHYAVQAFDSYALDYLLKPFDKDRFARAVDRARQQIEKAQSGDFARRLMNLLKDVKAGPRRTDRLVIKSGGRVIFLKAEEIDWIEAAANYVRLHVGKESHLLRETMNNLETQLDPDKFMRIHRSIIVNIDKIRELQPCNNGEYVVILQDGKELSLGRSYRDRLEQFLQRSMLAGRRSG
jgi:two-component system LytT family response regulator